MDIIEAKAILNAAKEASCEPGFQRVARSIQADAILIGYAGKFSSFKDRMILRWIALPMVRFRNVVNRAHINIDKEIKVGEEIYNMLGGRV